MKPKKRKIRIGLIVLSCVIVLMAAGVMWQWNNLKAAFLFLSYSEADLEAQLAADNSSIAEAMGKLPGNIPDLTEEQKQQLKDGSMTSQEAIDIILDNDNDLQPEPSGGEAGEAVPASPSASATPGAGDSAQSPESPGRPAASATPSSSPKVPEASPSPTKSPDERRIEELVAELYVLRVTYTSSIDALISQAYEEYNALPKSERTDKAQNKILLKYVGPASSLEADCDVQVNAILSELKTLLKKTNGDLSLIDDITSIYNSEKSTKKAYYMSQLG